MLSPKQKERLLHNSRSWPHGSDMPAAAVFTRLICETVPFCSTIRGVFAKLLNEYRVTLVVEYLGLVDSDLGRPPAGGLLL